MTKTNNYLFTITIASVQEYISQARKLKDLYAGSKIVSDLIRESIDIATNKDNIELILPYNKKVVSNKIVLEIENISKEEVEKFGEEMEKNIHNYFRTIISDENIEDFFNIFWIAVPKEDDYKKAYDKLEKNLGLTKNTRISKQNKKRDEKENNKNVKLKKCSLCGQRTYEKVNNEDKLCSICFSKRKYVSSNIPSLAKICLLDWLKDIDYSNLKEEYKNDSFDEECFFEEENIIENFIQKHNLERKKQKKYYALINLDIDNLGKKLSTLNKEEQKNLSEKLSKFAKEIKKIANKEGQTIYAGGDDFLAVINLTNFFETMHKIYEAFNIENLTFSTSIIISHYKTPLHKVLNYSKILLKESKDFYEDKNSIGFMFINGSAITAKSIFKYEDFKLLKELGEKNLALNLYFKLKTTFSYLEKMTYDDFLIHQKIIKIEIERLLKREENFDKEKEGLLKKLYFVLDSQKTEISNDLYEINFENFIGYLKSLEQLTKVLK